MTQSLIKHKFAWICLSPESKQRFKWIAVEHNRRQFFCYLYNWFSYHINADIGMCHVLECHFIFLCICPFDCRYFLYYGFCLIEYFPPPPQEGRLHIFRIESLSGWRQSSQVKSVSPSFRLVFFSCTQNREEGLNWAFAAAAVTRTRPNISENLCIDRPYFSLLPKIRRLAWSMTLKLWSLGSGNCFGGSFFYSISISSFRRGQCWLVSHFCCCCCCCCYSGSRFRSRNFLLGQLCYGFFFSTEKERVNINYIFFVAFTKWFFSLCRSVASLFSQSCQLIFSTSATLPILKISIYRQKSNREH